MYNLRITIIYWLLVPQLSFARDPSTTQIGQQTLSFMDESRHRPVVTEVWYPTDDTLKASDRRFSPFIRQYTVRNGQLPTHRMPLIMVSHGTGGGRLTMEWLVQGLAQNGFIVAAVDHWGNTFDNKVPLEFLKPWERPLDIRFALTALLTNTPFSKVIDSRRIGAAGFSFGGYTVIALAGAVLDYKALLTYYKTKGRQEIDIPELPGVAQHLDDPSLQAAILKLPSLQDDRIRAFLAISPALGQGFVRKGQMEAIQEPVYIMGSQSDQMAPVKTNADHYHALILGSGYYEFGGKTGHYVMLNEAIEEVKKSNPIYFTDDPTVDRHQVHAEVIRLADLFFREKLSSR
ncbi:alpha/beta hydrolase family protein [Spirosoma pollinicola]|uniref:Dienelactone hydrolase n=1 Tax=Spirosoma pollinicola TaxID=2057025 RepID=A0A2K8YWW5_9BACT|nr:dienelactone hydrolase [Spirosoma pollinicola]AUD02121.1 dienelactone hydrolase [Spirosoma pollinicola]